jgi:hypothetical protein
MLAKRLCKPIGRLEIVIYTAENSPATRLDLTIQASLIRGLPQSYRFAEANA